MSRYKCGDRVRVVIEAEVIADSDDDYLRLLSKAGGTLVIRSTDYDATIERVTPAGDEQRQHDQAGQIVVNRADLVAYLNRGTGDVHAKVTALNRLLAAAEIED